MITAPGTRTPDRPPVAGGNRTNSAFGASLAALEAINERATELRRRILDFQDMVADISRQDASDEQRKLLHELLAMSARFVGITSDIQLNVANAKHGESGCMFEFHRPDEVESILDRIEIFCCLMEDIR